jgi:hypothetical protein
MKTAMMNSKSFSTDNAFTDADTFYERLLDAHAGLSREESEALNARLILLMANQIGDVTVLSQCITAAQS